MADGLLFEESSCLTTSPLSMNQAIEAVSGPACGAVVTFSGCVRGTEEGHRIDAIHYDAYPAMANLELMRIVRQAEGRWPVVVYVRHRLGRVPVGEASVIVACGGAHRREAFDACQFVIDQLKSDVPIWKVNYERM